MVFDKARFITKALAVVGPYLGRAAIRRVAAYCHSWTWRNTPDAKSIIVLGGSFAVIELVRRLTEMLPTDYKVVWIEKHSHFNYIFNFPRYSVLKGHEQSALIPYDFVAKGAPLGNLTRIQDEAIAMTDSQVLLASDEQIDYACLAIATGSTQPLPANVSCNKRREICREPQSVQQTIEKSRRIAVVGGRAVGVQLASDIKDFFTTKEVTLVHSRGQLLNRFGNRLQDYVLTTLRDELKVRVLLNERLKLPTGGNFTRSTCLTFSDGSKKKFDLVVSLSF
jgi:NADH dehydrogenase FAD-containing subunit